MVSEDEDNGMELSGTGAAGPWKVPVKVDSPPVTVPKGENAKEIVYATISRFNILSCSQ